MSWLDKLLPPRIRSESLLRRSATQGIPEGVWTKCMACKATLFQEELEKSQRVCPKCQFHHPLSAVARLNGFLDEGSLRYLAMEVKAVDRLRFRDTKRYKDRLQAAIRSTNQQEALLVAEGLLEQQTIVAAAFEFGFIGGSMSQAVGERFVLGVEQAMSLRCPFVCFTASGGARMQEGLFSLFQMARTAHALKRLARMRIPYIVVLTHPTYGGVTASLAMLGDVHLAEPGAKIGFTGPRVIEQTMKEVLPEGFQSAESMLAHGFIDQIVARAELRSRISHWLTLLKADTA